MKEVNRKLYIVKYQYGSQWFEFHAKSKQRAVRFITEKKTDPRTGVMILKIK